MTAKSKIFLAFDLGAESARGIVGKLDDGKLKLKEIYRFETKGTFFGGHLHWDILGFLRQIIETMRLYKSKYDNDPVSIGVNTWGVDFGLLDKSGDLISNPFTYRDTRTKGIIEDVFKKISKEKIYSLTGTQFLPINTLYQLYSLVRYNSYQLKEAETFLMMPGLFNYFLTGEKVVEFSNAMTTQIFNCAKSNWANEIFNALEIPIFIMPDVTQSATKIKTITKTIQQETKMGKVYVVLPATHDTSSAFNAIPEYGEDIAFISSGTWSIMGINIKKPIINDDSLYYNLSHDRSLEGNYRLIKNVIGLWLIQECKRLWEMRDGLLSYDEISRLAFKSTSFKSIIDPTNPSFLAPQDTIRAIKEYCKNTSQYIPESKGEISRCIFESLAFRYKEVWDMLNKFSSKPLSRLHIIGGGCQNKLLNQFTSNVIGIPVIAGPIEATSIGNIIAQAISSGLISSLKEGRELISNSFKLIYFEPKEINIWKEAYKKYQNICSKTRINFK